MKPSELINSMARSSAISRFCGERGRWTEERQNARPIKCKPGCKHALGSPVQCPQATTLPACRRAAQPNRWSHSPGSGAECKNDRGCQEARPMH